MVLHYSTERHKWLPVQVPLLLQPLLCLPCLVSAKRPQSLADPSVAASTLSLCVGSSSPELLLQGQMGKADRELYVAQVVNLALFLVSLLTLCASSSVTDSYCHAKDSLVCPYCQGRFQREHCLFPWVFSPLRAPGRVWLGSAHGSLFLGTLGPIV